MRRLSSLAAIAVISGAMLRPAIAQTPGAAAAENAAPAGPLNSGNVPLKPSRATPPASFSKSPRREGERAATAPVAGMRDMSARTSAAVLTTKQRRNAGKTLAATRSDTYGNLRGNRSARSSAAALAFSPARAAPQERARTAAVRRKALRSLPTSAVLPKRPKSG